MRICLNLQTFNEVVLPVHYNYLIQALIYNSISPKLSTFLHEKGFIYGKRQFKLFTFSRLFGEYKIEDDKIRFNKHVTLYISSPIEQFVKEIANTFLKKNYIYIGRSKFKITQLYFPKKPEIENRVKVKTLSPITVYSTLISPDKKKKTYYYSPFETEFSKIISENAKKKTFILYRRDIKSDLKIKPIKVREVILMYKGLVIKGWFGSLELSGPKSLIDSVYETGVGSKNSQGFGMIEVIK